MKRFFALGLIALAFVVGCNSDEEDLVLTPGDAADPEYTAFTQEFDEVDQTTADMAGAAFDAVGVFTNARTPGLTPVASPALGNFQWNDGTQKWEGDWTRTNQYATVNVHGTVQFWVGNTVVQHPSELVTKVMTTVDASDNGSTQGYGLDGSQSMVITRAPGDSVLTLNGNGSIEVTFSRTRTDESGTTTCAGTKAFESELTNVVLPDNGRGADQCPISGTTSHGGSISVACTGAQAGSRTGRWTATSTFDNGTVHHRYTHGTHVWMRDSSCGG